MSKRRYNVRRLKATLPYSVQEVAELFGIHKGAVLRWLRQGLPAHRDQRPFLIRGDDLAQFLTERQSANHHRCGAAEFFCFRCRAPRRAWLGIADINVETPTRFRVKALCDVCGTKVNKTQAIRALPRIRELFEVQELTGEHLLERPDPNA